MTDLAATDSLFFERTGMDRPKVERIVADALQGADDGELFMEYRQSESFSFDDGRMKNAAYDTSQGFGLRSVSNEATGYAHASELSESAIERAADTVRAVRSGKGGEMSVAPNGTNRNLYTDVNPLSEVPFDVKVKLMEQMDAYARSIDDRIRQVSVSLTGSWQAVQIIRADGRRAADIRPLIRLNASVVAAKGDRMESGSHGVGGRIAYA
ncbi:MAG: DNA gyrase modulator, partial [Rhodospirillales bacterium]